MDAQREKKTALFVVLLLIFGAMMCCGGTLAIGAWGAKKKLDAIKLSPLVVEDETGEESPDTTDDDDSPSERPAFIIAVMVESSAQGHPLHVYQGEDEGDPDDDVFAAESGPLPGRPNVTEAFERWSGLDPAARPSMVEALVRSTYQVELPADWASARSHLVSTVRPRIVSELNALQKKSAFFQQTLADDLLELVGYQDGAHVQLVTHDDAQKWGQSAETLFTEARQHPAGVGPAAQFKKISPGLWEANSGDGNDIARLLSPAGLKRPGLKGDPVVFPVLPGTVLVIGSADQKVVEAAGNRIDELANDSAESSRKGWRLDQEGLLQPWDAPAGSLLAVMGAETDNNRYALQKDLLDRGGTPYADDDVFVASVLEIETDDESTKTYAVWTKGFTTLIPRVDYLLFVEATSDSTTRTWAAAPWSEAQRLIGPQMKPEAGLWPPRWRVKTFPSQKNLERLGIDPLFKVDDTEE